MELKAIETLIARITDIFTVKATKSTKKVVVIFGVLSAAVCASIGNIPLSIGCLIVMTAEWMYFRVAYKKRPFTAYRVVRGGFLFILYFVITLNIWLYCVQITLRFFDPVLFTALLIIEAAGAVIGFFYTKRCVKKGAVSKPKMTAYSGLITSAGLMGYYGFRCIIVKTPMAFQQVLITICLSVGGFMMMVILGMFHIAVWYYVKKYRIPDHEIALDGE